MLLLQYPTPSVSPPYEPLIAPTAIVATNANTTYGIDTSAGNNYGLGPGFMSTQALAAQSAAINAQPSILWLVAAIAVIWMVTK